MVTEAVAELKGEPVKQSTEVSIELPVDAILPEDYVAKETSRLEAYRRLASVETLTELEDIRTEWTDRFGPVPPPAEALLAVGRLRVECLRTGITEITVTTGTGFGGPDHIARISRVRLPASRQVRLDRLYSRKGSGNSVVYNEQTGVMQLPLRKKDGTVVDQLVDVIADVVPDLMTPVEPDTVPVS
jgi:transcription-repair coupling factor (superfamily II helicase)